MSKSKKTSAKQGANGDGRKTHRLIVKRPKNGSKTEVFTVSGTSTKSCEILVTENGVTMPLGVEYKRINYRSIVKKLFVLNFESARITLTTSQFVAFLQLVNRFASYAKINVK